MAGNFVKRSLEGHSVAQARNVRKDRWDQPGKRVLRERILAFLEDDDITLFSERVSDTVIVNEEPVRIRIGC